MDYFQPDKPLVFIQGNPTEGFTAAHGPYASHFGDSPPDNEYPINLHPCQTPAWPEDEQRSPHILLLLNIKGFQAIGPLTTRPQIILMQEANPEGVLMRLNPPQREFEPEDLS